MSAEDFAVKIKGLPEQLFSNNALELLFTNNTRFKSIVSFREAISSLPEETKNRIV
jgi:hypothetical protein